MPVSRLRQFASCEELADGSRLRLRLCILAILLLTGGPSVARAEAEHAPSLAQASLSDWELAEGFSLDAHALGFEYPTALAFVPEPGAGPDAPLYFVAELRGRIKVVTRSGAVHLFADDFSSVQDQTTTEGRKFVESGTAGLCLAPEQGYVFVTTVYRGPNGVLRNGMFRFSSEPERFSLAARGRMDLSLLFRAEPSYESHQIGPCQVEQNLLYVAVGDAFKLKKSQSLNSTLGRILRMDLDGAPVPDNPYFRPQLRNQPVNYVWAYGLRNPFGLEIVDGRVFVAENGPNVDRFLEVSKGEKLLWDGRDWSIGTNAAVVFSPAVSPVQIGFLDADSEIFPEAFRDRFYVALSGSLGPAGPGAAGEKSIVSLHYNFATGRMSSPPATFLRYRGSPLQALAGLAVGPDGLYFAPLLPDASGASPVLRVRYQPEQAHDFIMGETHDPVLLMEQAACLGCHQLGGRGGTAAPALDQPELNQRLLDRLNSRAYLESLTALDRRSDEPYPSTRQARSEVSAAEGIERLRVWLRHRLAEPRFDTTSSAMPKPDLDGREISIIVDYLLDPPSATAEPPEDPEVAPEADRQIPLLAAFAAGVVATMLAGMLRRRSAAD